MKSLKTGMLWLLLGNKGQRCWFHWSWRVTASKLPSHYDDSLANGHAQHSKSTLPPMVLQCVWGSWKHNGLFEGLIQSTWLWQLQQSGPLKRHACDFYRDDFNHDLLEPQLLTFSGNLQRDTILSSKSTKFTTYTIFDIRVHFKALSGTPRSRLSQVGWVLQLALVTCVCLQPMWHQKGDLVPYARSRHASEAQWVSKGCTSYATSCP